MSCRLRKDARRIALKAQEEAARHGVTASLEVGGRHLKLRLRAGDRCRCLPFASNPSKPEEVEENFVKQVRRTCRELTS